VGINAAGIYPGSDRVGHGPGGVIRAWFDVGVYRPLLSEAKRKEASEANMECKLDYQKHDYASQDDLTAHSRSSFETRSPQRTKISLFCLSGERPERQKQHSFLVFVFRVALVKLINGVGADCLAQA
jgi:hypothetical protein